MLSGVRRITGYHAPRCLPHQSTMRGPAMIVISRNFSVSRQPEILASLPDGSPSFNVMEKCVEYAQSRVPDLSAAYDPWPTTEIMQNTLLMIHDLVPSMGWSGAVIAFALSVRAVMFPIALRAVRQTRLRDSLLPEYRKLTDAVQNGDERNHNDAYKRYAEFLSTHGVWIPAKGLGASFMQWPFLVMGISAINGMAWHPSLFPSLAMSTPLWLDSLSLPDPTYALPVLYTALLGTMMKVFGSVDVGIDTPKTENFKSIDSSHGNRVAELLDSDAGRKAKKIGAYALPCVIFYVTVSFPACTQIYLIVHVLTAIAQSKLLQSPRFQVLMDIPPAKAVSNSVLPSTIAAQTLEMQRGLEKFRQARIDERAAKSASSGKSIHFDEPVVGIISDKISEKLKPHRTLSELLAEAKAAAVVMENHQQRKRNIKLQ